jgi:hypothetical protein
MATLQQIQTAADTRLANLWAGIQTKEATFFGNHGYFAQLLRTHNVIPADGATALPDIGAAVPYYMQAGDGWPNAILTQVQPCAFEIHQYVTPDGTCGYQAFVWVTINSHLWSRSQQVGPESFRAYNWTDFGVPS